MRHPYPTRIISLAEAKVGAHVPAGRTGRHRNSSRVIAVTYGSSGQCVKSGRRCAPTTWSSSACALASIDGSRASARKRQLTVEMVCYTGLAGGGVGERGRTVSEPAAWGGQVSEVGGERGEDVPP